MRRPTQILLFWTVGAGLIFAGFQNCSQVGFAVDPSVLEADRATFNSGSNILIDRGADFTNQKTIQVSMSSPRAVLMKLSKQPDCSDGVWEKYQSESVQQVTTPNSVIAVYAQFQDLADNISPCRSDDITHDDQKPVAAYKTADGQFTNQVNTKVEWTVSDSLSGVDKVICHDNAGALVACTTSMVAYNDKEGQHTVTVRARDRAGNETADLILGWVYDKTAPSISINTKPSNISGAATAAFSFSGVDALSGIASYSCKIDGAAAATCTSPLNLSSLAGGAHSFEVTATDKAGNTSPAATFSWNVDLTAPDIRFTKTPDSITNIGAADFAFTATDEGMPITDLYCSLDGGAFAACASPKKTSALPDGDHRFEVKAKDLAGNMSSPISYNWKIDTALPTLSFIVKPPSISNDIAPLFRWSAADASGIKTVICSLDNNVMGPCADAKTLAALTEGPHVFKVEVTDNAGNKTSVSHSWKIDLTAPVVTITAQPANPNSATTANFAFAATDDSAISGYECKVDLDSYAACTSAKQITNLVEGGHVFYVRAIDAAGNVSVPASYSWNIDLAGPLIRVISAPATAKQGSTAAISYEVIDVSSGIGTVKCGLTSPVSAVTDCPAVSVTQAGPLDNIGAYTFEIRATDKVGNSTVEMVTIQVTSKPVVCDPFNSEAEGLCNGGLLGEIYNLTGQTRTDFVNMPTKTVDFFYARGTKINALLNLNSINVTTRQFTAGFPTQSGAPLVDGNGNVLDEYFAFRLNTVVKLDPATDLPGWYVFATSSDDGSILSYKPAAGGMKSVLVSNDGDHSTSMKCSSKAIYISDASRLPMELKYYQGPRTEIALVLLWQKVSSEAAAQSTACANGGGWKVMAPGNFIAPASLNF